MVMQTELAGILQSLDHAGKMYPASLTESRGVMFFIAVVRSRKQLCAVSADPIGQLGNSEHLRVGGRHVCVAPLDWDTYLAAREYLPWIAPVSLRNVRTTFGCGDRLGRAAPGHIRACLPYDLKPVLAQQSVRELTFTDRTYRDVVKDAAFLVLQEGYKGGFGADGDHIKEMEDIRRAVDAGMPMITLDLTEQMNPVVDSWTDHQVEQKYCLLPRDCRDTIESKYAGKSFNIGECSVPISSIEAKRCALMYWRAVEYTAEVDAYLRSRRGDAYDLEVSIDETTVPTKPAHHVFIASELARRNVTVNSLAPRFVGEFQKGIDYIGDMGSFEKDFSIHCDIANAFGGYKISIHSGSDKFSVYPFIGKRSGFKVHVKTSGTSWLEAVHAAAILDPSLFRNMYRKAGMYAEAGLKQYHITADFSRIPQVDSVKDEDLPKLLEVLEPRQMLHVCYGQMLGDLAVRNELFSLLDSNEQTHYRCVEDHIARHIIALGAAPVHA